MQTTFSSLPTTCSQSFFPSRLPSNPPLRRRQRCSWLLNASHCVDLAIGTPCRFHPRNDVIKQSSRLLWATLQHRLFFTTFPHPPPKEDSLNEVAIPLAAPKIRGTSRNGLVASPDEDAKYYYFTIDDQLVYMSFFQDWGPLNIAMVYKACIYIHSLLAVRYVSGSLHVPVSHVQY